MLTLWTGEICDFRVLFHYTIVIMEKILANIHSTNRPDLQQFQTEIDGIQKEAARNNG